MENNEQVTAYFYDEKGYLTGFDIATFIDGIPVKPDGVFNLTLIPPSSGYIKSLFTGTEWIEGATQEEIQAWEEANKKEEVPDKMGIRLNQIEQAVGVLATQVAKNTLLQGGTIV